MRHRGEYWAIADTADIDTSLTALATARAATDRLGTEEPVEWGPSVDAEDA